jgi:cytochrome c-type biogenesis protein CcmH
MIWFWSAAGLLLMAVLVGILRPLIRQPRSGDESGEAVAVFRRQLAEVEVDAAQGRLAADAADAARSEIARRLLAAADREAAGATLPTGSPAEMSWRIGAAVGIAAVLPAAAIAIYLWVGAPFPSGGSAAPGQAIQAHDEAELAAAADTLAARAKAEPGNLEDWVMLGRTAAALQRFAEARDAYRRAIALAPDRPELRAELGEVLVLEAEGVVTPAAEAEFAKAGTDPRARYYGAEAALQHGDTNQGAALLRALLADAPADAPWRKLVAQRLAEVMPAAQPTGGEVPASPSGSGPPAAGSSAAGPTAQDIAAAQEMTPQEREAMIRGMVARLAARLEQHPDDKEGWARLAHAYDVLGETGKAAMARNRAAAAVERSATSPATPPAAPR